MEIIENISLWGGIAGVVTAVFAIVILYLTRSNIIDLLDKDAIMYDKNYEMKKTAFQNAFDILDYYELYGMEVRTSKQFIQKAKAAYNDLMCTAYLPKVYEEFYKLTLNMLYTQITVQDISNYKMLCRYDMGLRNKKIKPPKVDNSPLISQLKVNSPMQSMTGNRPVVPNQPPKPRNPQRPTIPPTQE